MKNATNRLTRWRWPVPVLACVIGTIAMSGLAFGAVQPDGPAARTEQNKRTVLAFYDAGLNRKDIAEASRHLGQRYIQHNPTASDGREGFASFIHFLRATYPDSHSSVRQVFAEGDFVILHVHERLRPGDRGNAIVDIFRLERGQVVEHWDVKQPIPEHAANPNGMFQQEIEP